MQESNGRQGDNMIRQCVLIVSHSDFLFHVDSISTILTESPPLPLATPQPIE
jgi:hypothetical protein